MNEDIQFERCIDFLARMIEKYGDELLTEQMKDQEETGEKVKEAVQQTGKLLVRENPVCFFVFFICEIALTEVKNRRKIKLGQMMNKR